MVNALKRGASPVSRAMYSFILLIIGNNTKTQNQMFPYVDDMDDIFKFNSVSCGSVVSGASLRAVCPA